MQKGFTLVELLISLFIVAIITTMGLAAFLRFGETKKLRYNAQNLVMKISDMKLAAFAGRKVNGDTPLMFGVAVLPTASRAFKLFADENGDCQFNASDVTVEDVALSGGIAFANIGAGQSVCFKTFENIVCLPSACGGTGTLRFYLLAKGKTAEVWVDLATGLAKASVAK